MRDTFISTCINEELSLVSPVPLGEPKSPGRSSALVSLGRIFSGGHRGGTRISVEHRVHCH